MPALSLHVNEYYKCRIISTWADGIDVLGEVIRNDSRDSLYLADI